MMHRSVRLLPFISLLLLAALIALLSGVAGSSGEARAEGLGRIANGVKADAARHASRWPFIVAVHSTGHAPRRSHFCGGTLISPRLVLTAAHCVDDENGKTVLRSAPRSVSVLAGTSRLSTPRAGVTRVVSDVLVHPRWNANLSRNDIAVLRLASPMPIGGAIQTVQIVSPEEASWWGNGTAFAESAERGPWAAGWGNRKPWRGENFPDVLHEVQLPIVDDAACRAPRAPGLGGFLGGLDTRQYFCAGVPDSDRSAANGSTGRDVCSGDSGGPLIVGDGAGQWRQVGLVSAGGACAGAHYSSFTRLVNYRSWIESIADAPGTGPGGIRPVQRLRVTRRTATSITLAWSAPVGGARRYVAYEDDDEGSLLPPKRTTKRTVTFTGLQRNARYVFWVAAADARGEQSPLRRVVTYTRR